MGPRRLRPSAPRMSSARTALEVGQSPRLGLSLVAILRYLACVGFTRRAIGASYEGQTKEEDGQVWADAEVEGIDSDVGHFVLGNILR